VPTDTTRRRGARRLRLAFMPTSTFEPNTRLVDPRRPRRPPTTFLLLGFLGALAGQLAAAFFFHGGETFGGSYAFTLCALGGFVFPIFQRNRKEIWDLHTTPARANAFLARDLTLIFLGIALAYLVLPLVWGVPGYVETFRGVGQQIGDRYGTGLNGLCFDDPLPTFLANARVLLVFYLVGAIFRHLGVLFVIIVNASHWGVVLAAAFAGTLVHGEHQWFTTGLALALLLCPHLLLEMTSYVAGAMAGVFTGRALARYRLGSRPVYEVGRWVLLLLVTGMVLLAFAALVEGLVVRRLYHLVTGG
jgi:hypothetical protein